MEQNWEKRLRSFGRVWERVHGAPPPPPGYRPPPPPPGPGVWPPSPPPGRRPPPPPPGRRPPPPPGRPGCCRGALFRGPGFRG